MLRHSLFHVFNDSLLIFYFLVNQTTPPLPNCCAFCAQENPMQVFVKTITGELFAFDVNSTDCIEQVKQAIFDRDKNTPPDQVYLICAGRSLEDGHTLRSYNIAKESVLHIAPPLHGGSEKLTRCVNGVLQVIYPSRQSCIFIPYRPNNLNIPHYISI